MVNFYFFIGTKAQIIKCIPLINKIKNIKHFNPIVVSSGQHKSIVDSAIETSLTEVERINLYKNNKDITRYFQGIKWIFSFIKNYLIFKTKLKDENNENFCIVHGDTISTLLGVYWGKRNKLKLIHLESGLTSNKWFVPFPEEIVRRFVAQKSDILICFDENSKKRLENKYKEKHIFMASDNTVIETLDVNNLVTDSKKVTITLHRTENIVNKKRFSKFLQLINVIGTTYNATWFLHEPTKNYLNKHKLEIPNNISVSSLRNHEDFLEELKTSYLVITDGGSIQEECFYLGKNAIIWRGVTERPEALNKNMIISDYDNDEILNFIKNLENNVSYSKTTSSPSDEIVDYLRAKFKI